MGGSGLSLPLSKQVPALYLYAYIFGQGLCGEDERPGRGHELQERFTGVERRQAAALVERPSVEPLVGRRAVTETLYPGSRLSRTMIRFSSTLQRRHRSWSSTSVVLSLLIVINTAIGYHLLVRRSCVLCFKRLVHGPMIVIAENGLLNFSSERYYGLWRYLAGRLP